MTALNCDQCEMLSINGVACHETGCPNMGARWDGEQWIKQRECIECGCAVDADAECCNAEPEPDRHCLIDGSWGIYVPERFARWAQSQRGYTILNVTPADLDELARGLDVEGYWDLWDEILRDAELVDNHNATHYTLEQDGDLFMVAQS